MVYIVRFKEVRGSGAQMSLHGLLPGCRYAFGALK